MLRFRWQGMLVLDAERGDVVFRAKAACALDVVPCEIYARKFGPGPVCVDFVGLLQGRELVVGVFFAFELDAKVIHDEVKKDRPPLVAPKAGCDEALVVAMLGEAFSEQVIREIPGLF